MTTWRNYSTTLYSVNYENKDEGWNFEEYDFRMADISNLKVNECSNVERPNLRKSRQ